jgi:hypothetical protein
VTASTISTRVRSGARGRCSTPLGITMPCRGSSSTVWSLKSMSSLPFTTEKNSSSRSCLCQQNPPFCFEIKEYYNSGLTPTVPKFLLWIKFLHACGADTMTEISFRVPDKIMFNGMPIVFIIPDAFTVSADRNNAS